MLAEPYRSIPSDMREDDDTTRGWVNFNYVCYLEVYDQAGSRRPGAHPGRARGMVAGTRVGR